MGYKGCPDCGKTMKDTDPACPHCGESDSTRAGRGAKFLCTTCGTLTNGRTITKGSFAIEVILWLAMILPGILYSIWRLTSRVQGCHKCSSAAIIPVSSPVAQATLARMAP